MTTIHTHPAWTYLKHLDLESADGGETGPEGDLVAAYRQLGLYITAGIQQEWLTGPMATNAAKCLLESRDAAMRALTAPSVSPHMVTP